VAFLMNAAGEGDPPDAEHRVEGRLAHAEFERVVASHHNAGLPGGRSNQDAPADSRCFVATAVYGEAAEETQQLRRFRDRVLLSHRGLAWLVPTYYAMSPGVARRLSISPSACHLARRCLSGLLFLMPSTWTDQ